MVFLTPSGAGEGKMMTFGIGMLRYRLLKLKFLMISFLLNKLYFLSQERVLQDGKSLWFLNPILCFFRFSIECPFEITDSTYIRAFSCILNRIQIIIFIFYFLMYFHFRILYLRVHYAGYNVTRPEGDLGKYKSIPHHHRGEVQFLGR